MTHCVLHPENVCVLFTGKYPIQMLEALLMMYISIPGKMNYGVSCKTSELLSVYRGIFEYII